MTATAPPQAAVTDAAEVPAPRSVPAGLWLVAGALLLLASWSRDTVLAAVGSALFAAALVAATQSLGQHGRWARGTAAGTVVLAVAAVGLGSPAGMVWTGFLWAGVVGALVWAAAGWKRRLAAQGAEHLHAEWALLQRQGLLLAHLLVLGGAVAATQVHPGSGWAALPLLAASVFGLVWGLHALRVLSATARAVGGGPRSSMVPAAVIVVLVGMFSSGWAADSREVARGSFEVPAPRVACEATLIQPGAPLTTVVLRDETWREQLGPFQLSLRRWAMSTHPPHSEWTYEIRTQGLLGRTARVEPGGGERVTVSGWGLGTLQLDCRPDVAMPPGSAPAP